ncbi:putative transcription factor C2H2 family [Helianthus annuus]|nr:putative transcription factor C2H2 family [Helianthus annuus]KAJ0510637.1 putative transcription factor C2H2 family [Helianthus annuus]KAJ0876239.1 putative transcription factor C2H2 family [Helianthus annuus]
MNTNESASSSNPHNNLGTITLGLSSVLELLKCPVCTNYMYPPIHQCRNGHTLCFECETHVQNQCPTCRQELGNIRSFALEKFVQLLQLPCRYSSSGCLGC